MKYNWYDGLDDTTKEFLEDNGCLLFGIELNPVYKADRKCFNIELNVYQFIVRNMKVAKVKMKRVRFNFKYLKEAE